MTEPRRNVAREGSGWGPVAVQALQQHKGRQYRADPDGAASTPAKIVQRVDRIIERMPER